MNKDRFKTILILVLFTILIGREWIDADARQANRVYKFDKYLPRGGGIQTLMDTNFEQKYDYLKLEMDTTEGKIFDVRLLYSTDLLQKNKKAVEKLGIKADGKKHTLYFIPKKGKCPGKKSECIRVPVIKGVTTKNSVIDSKGVIYGIEIYNGCLDGDIPRIKGKLTYHYYDEES